MGQDKWKYRKLLRSRYGRKIWIVARGSGEKGYFKFPLSSRHNDYRILVANEYIAAELARLVGLPAAPVKGLRLKGPGGRHQRGIVSVSANAKEVVPWKKAWPDVHQFPEQHIEQAERLARLVVFDGWILNPDRTNRNLILYRNHAGERFRWYMIDHSLALFGAPEKYLYGSERKYVLRVLKARQQKLPYIVEQIMAQLHHKKR